MGLMSQTTIQKFQYPGAFILQATDFPSMPTMGRVGRPTKKRKAPTGVTLVAQGQGPVKRTQLHPYDCHGSDEKTYEVEEILAERTVQGGKPHWLISWVGLSEKANTWEPIENLAGHEQDIASFRSKREEENHERAVKKKKQSENVEVIDDDAPKWVEGKSGKRKSAVWQLFQVELADGKVLRTRCKLCPDSTEPQQYPGNTSNLRSHLTHGDSAHKDAFCEVCKIEKEEVNLQKEESTTDSKPRTIYALHAAPCVPG
ncbi:hypothetical protein CYMTET_3433 [Cymbomonas tetramitiformis]|uniref:Chromo domain-containing protein n=1 Tax=Cymbomonas tetramitiformis TaxID=36881 RepID=A0AAE0LL21_9CHLO|nr:hypothetical protein CYMTET_3433 [Cymbomonas tetramitiformis]